ncbi:hypothetical protein Tsubulata_008275 [Turnera subulata]|uniref:F-box domain-containing protein n=1 Tax=Turnera subulata TaxID=218843 RepID=A0A9Q0J461_9ROSI|nr:hypothetical protein Tsubulata_008275 [Turnera subulata]
MSNSPVKKTTTTTNPNPNPNPSLLAPIKTRTKTLSFSDNWFRDLLSPKHASPRRKMMQQQFNHHHHKNSDPDLSAIAKGLHSLTLHPPAPDHTSLLTDHLLLKIFSRLPASQYVPNSLVCKRWLHLHGRLVQSVRVSDWSFVNSGRVFSRFPNLTSIDIVRAGIRTPQNSSSIVATDKSLSVPLGTRFSPDGFLGGSDLLPSGMVDQGLGLIAKWYPNLRRIAVIGAGEDGLVSVSSNCDILQEMELHCCGDFSLKGISGCRNLQVVKLIGCVFGFYNSVVSDIGLTILAQGCRRLVKLELCGCEGSYDGIKAIGQCCQMLEELTVCDHRMDGGWLAALSFCGNLKTLRLQSCKSIDVSPGPEEHLWSCPALEELHLEKCQMRDKQAVKALFLVCQTVKEIVLQNCWGLEDEVFATVGVCRRVRLLSLEGCSALTTGGLESVILNWKELQELRVVSCNKIKDVEVSPALASLFSDLKELKWRPDSRSFLSSSLEGTGVGNKGAKFFKRSKLESFT